MNIDKILLVIVFLIFSISCVTFGSLIFKESLRSDLIKDMAERGYYQKIVKDKVLWVKDEK